MRNYSIIGVVSLFLILCLNSLFIVQEGQRGIVLRFGKVLRNINNQALVYDPGLHVKVPFIESVKILDARIQTMENQADRFVTMEKKDLIIDSYIKWRISDFSRYYLATGGGDISQAEVLIKRKFSDRLRSELGKLNVQGIVTDSRNRLMSDVREALNYGNSGEDSESYTTTMIDRTLASATARVDELNGSSVYSSSLSINPNSMAALGIKIVDVRIKQINLPTEVSDAIYQRMRAEREAVARRHRSQGQEEAEKLRAAADYEVTKILSEAKRESLIIRGEADAETAKLYASVFSVDPNFYAFLRTLRAYENSFMGANNDVLVLNSESEFFRFMKAPDDFFSK
ncbi:protease modulator HflC [Blochmannia endosymbiont of Polyrhachis (Hedomyrma) turneri]|uniref:protease modulator HflC n=1 Tax=Blochmannia endosymbiont of Polyrhachis (Hedomyrma) turneri TaxID=1505596 RepID=UPI00061A58F1|nr:protease modulator HflC [Blochmannia endosymbiont of Polyrhachis (Hedomyrma) turneri]AKC59668.1 Modulator of FtsH protease HflC [Blochmannia endosymbiont of Polyrhachis (Hedomyrma) turneri]